MVVALGWAYTHFHGLPWIHAVFFGVGACVIGIIAHSAYKLTAPPSVAIGYCGWCIWSWPSRQC
jgi:chromate transporter